MPEFLLSKNLKNLNLQYLFAVKELSLQDLDVASKLFMQNRDFCKVLASLTVSDINRVSEHVTVPLSIVNKLDVKYLNELIKILSLNIVDDYSIKKINIILLNGASYSERC
jgi:hypothetical protein